MEAVGPGAGSFRHAFQVSVYLQLVEAPAGRKRVKDGQRWSDLQGGVQVLKETP